MARIFISSTYDDLRKHREKVRDALAKAGHVAVGMEDFPASGRRPLAQCLKDVASCEVYVGIFAWRLGFVPAQEENPEGKSITELELRHAQSRGMLCLIFLLDEGEPWLQEYIDKGVEPRPMDRLREALKTELTVAFFTSPDDLATSVLVAVGKALQEAQPRSAAPDRPEPSPTPPRAVPPPPELYAVPEYTLTYTFIGRRAELAELNAWAASPDSVLVVEAIGGMGKSALTWEWVQEAAASHIPGLAGRVWWSFYERGTSMKTFLRHALAYVTRQDPETLHKLDTFDCGQQLLAELRRKPYLLVLDGFERVLTAYHLSDKAQVRDDRVRVDKRECTNPKDGDVLRQLVRCGPSKVLVSTRLMPKALEDRSTHRPISGVRRRELEGLAPEDALRMVRHAGVRGDSAAILQFAEQFGRHPLVLRIVCGMVNDYRLKPGDFDAWYADPYTGGGLKLSELPLVQRYTHILEHAFRGLGEKQRQLLSRIAVLSDSADYGTIAVLNPFLPPRPVEAPEPSDDEHSYRERRFQRQLTYAKTPEESAEIEAERTTYQAKHLEERQAYKLYQEALRAYYESAEYHEAVASFHVALSDLEDRGLLQWDRDKNTYDLHPVVRGYAFEQLEERDRTGTYTAISDHFAGLPPENLEEATELSDVKNSLEIMRALIGAGRLEEAAYFYRGDLCNSLLFSIGAFHILIEILEPILRLERNEVPLLTTSARSHLVSSLEIAYWEIGQYERAFPLSIDVIGMSFDEELWNECATCLRNLSATYYETNQLALAVRVDILARELSLASGDEEGFTVMLLDQAADSITRGLFEQAEPLISFFQKRKLPPYLMYRPGRADCLLATLRFFQNLLTERDLKYAEQVAAQSRNNRDLLRLARLRASWELTRDNPVAALDAIEKALLIVRRTGRPASADLGVRALALARLARTSEAREALAEAEEIWDGRLPAFPLVAAEAYFALEDLEKARELVRRAYPLAWADGPPYINWYELKRCRELMAELGEPEPQLPPFDADKVAPIPYEAEIRVVIEKLNEERAKNT